MLPKRVENASGHFHAVRFYENAESLCQIVAEFLAEGLATAQPAIIIATSMHRAAIVQNLHARSFDVERLTKSGDLIVLDADMTLSAFLVDDRPDAALFRATMVPVIEKACRGRQDCTIRAYGEMVDVLWKAGQTLAATRLEVLWNQLAQTHDFSLLCGYAMGNFYKDAAIEEICAHHSHVVSSTGEVAAVH